MAQKPWWLPEGVEPQQVIDLYESGEGAKRIIGILGLPITAKTVLAFLRANNIEIRKRLTICLICSGNIDKGAIGQKFCKTCIPDSAAKQRYRTYGITQPQYDLMFESQMGLCDLCFTPLENNVHIDHCHKQGHNRALLHQRCNVGLSYLEDDKFVAQAFRYIERHKR